MTGILGNDLPPGLRGFLAARQQQDTQGLREMQMLQGILGMQQAARENEMFPLKQALLQGQVDEQKRLNGILGQYNVGGVQQSSPQAVQGALSQGVAMGDVGPTVTNAARMGAPAGSPMELPANIQLGLLHPKLAPLAKAQAEAYKPTDAMREAVALGYTPGSPQFNAYIGTKFNQGGAWQMNPQGGVQLAPGYAEGRGSIEDAEQRSRARYDLVKVDPTSPGSPPTFNSRLNLLPGAPVVRETAPDDASGLARATELFRSGQPFSVSVPPPNGPIPTSSVAGKPAGMSPIQNTYVKGIEAASSEAGQLDAKAYNGFRESIPKVQGVLRRLDRLEQLTADDRTYASAGAELKTQLGSIAQGLGLPVNKDKTANSEEYIAHIAELLKDRLASKDYGSGTGVSNVDLLAAKTPLPDLMRTPQGRMQIISALRQDAQRSIQDMSAARDYFDRNRSLQGFRYPSEISTQIQSTKPSPQRPATDGRKVIDFTDWK